MFAGSPCPAHHLAVAHVIRDTTTAAVQRSEVHHPARRRPTEAVARAPRAERFRLRLGACPRQSSRRLATKKDDLWHAASRLHVLSPSPRQAPTGDRGQTTR